MKCSIIGRVLSGTIIKNIEKYLAEHEKRELKLRATTDGVEAYREADYVIIAAPVNYAPQKNFFNCSVVEAVIDLALKSNEKAIMVIKGTILMGYIEEVREQLESD